MKVITKEYKVYEFKELSREAKDKAIAKWYEYEDYPFLEDDLKEQLNTLIEEAGVKVIDKGSLYFDLNYSQGAGAMFTGVYEWQGHEFSIKHSGHYYHYNSKIIDTEAPEDVAAAFNDLYVAICRKIEKAGYKILEYRMDDNEFQEHCEANEYNFLEDGKMVNY